MYRLALKRVIDFTLASVAFFLLMPVFIVVAILLAIQLGGSPFFIQQRPGLNGRIFRILKFKTMLELRNEAGELLPDNERLFTMGRVVRKFSLDEIPQLVNVIKGDMSLIGPRPLLPSYLKLYTPTQNRRHEVRPGITGWAQVNGRNAISWSERFKLDVWYVDNLSFFLDIKILFLTLVKVLKREGISGNGSETMTAFKGQEDE
jgi:undecaprenyl phosphate N,N'-diacetylbacillosamine 1-phosphate transferase